MKQKMQHNFTFFTFWIMAWMYSSHGWAQSIDAIVQDGADYLISRLGPALFLVGIAITGISIALGNIGAVRKGAYVVGGGITVMAAQGIFNAIAQFAR